MIALLVALPIAVPLVTAAACLVAWRRVAAQRVLALAGLAVQVCVAVLLVVAVGHAGPAVLAVGGWTAPVGIVFRADMFGALMTLIAAVIAFVVGLYSLRDLPPEHQRRGYWPVMVLLVMGVCGAFLTADLFNLYVWLEVMLIASFVLLALGSEREQLAGTHVYLILKLVGSTLYLIGIGLLYASVRALDFASVSDRLVELSATSPGLVLAIEALFLVALGIQAAVFPLMFWLPASYHTPRPAVSALFAALLTKVGVYAMIRITAGVFVWSEAVRSALVLVAALTMAIGVLGALAQPTMRRILSFHIVSQIGYMVAGLAIAGGSPAMHRFAIAAAVFYVLHHILVKANLFLVAGIVRRIRGTERLDRLGGVARSHPYLAAMFLISALSLAGVPPLSGFWAKLAIIAGSLERGEIALAIVAVVVGLLTLASMLKIWLAVFAGEAPAGERVAPPPGRRELAPMYVGVTILAALTVAIGIAPDLLLGPALDAADQLRIGSPPLTSEVVP
jgi:multicomponent Na+:H+ antiporter subunit D